MMDRRIVAEVPGEAIGYADLLISHLSVLVIGAIIGGYICWYWARTQRPSGQFANVGDIQFIHTSEGGKGEPPEEAKRAAEAAIRDDPMVSQVAECYGLVTRIRNLPPEERLRHDPEDETEHARFNEAFEYVSEHLHRVLGIAVRAALNGTGADCKRVEAVPVPSPRGKV